jgi:hypothetical protein
MHKKTPLPLDTKPIVVYSKNVGMDTINKWQEKRDKTREPCRVCERARPKGQPEVFTRHPRERRRKIALFPRRFCPVFEGGVYYSLRPNYLRSPTLKTVQFHIAIACPADLPPPVTPRAPRSNVLTFHVLPRRSPAKAGAMRRWVTHQPIVTAELDIFYTFSPSHLKNTPHRPLPFNRLRKMPGETVQFQVDFACRAALPRSLAAPKHQRGGGSIRAKEGHAPRLSSPQN